MTKIDFVNFEDVFDEFVDYMEENKKHMRQYADSALDIDWHSYRTAAENGNMMIVTLRHDGRLCGFSVYVLSTSLRDKKEMHAENHGIYVEKAYRAKFGERLIVAGNKFLQSRGVLQITFTNDSKPFGRLLKKIGFKPQFTVWSLNYGK